MVMKTLILLKNAKKCYLKYAGSGLGEYTHYYSFYANDLSQTKNLNFN